MLLEMILVCFLSFLLLGAGSVLGFERFGIQFIDWTDSAGHVAAFVLYFGIRDVFQMLQCLDGTFIWY